MRPASIRNPRVPSLLPLSAAALAALALPTLLPPGTGHAQTAQQSHVPAAAAEFAPPRLPSPGELAEAGWTVGPGAVQPGPGIVQPRIPLTRGIALLTRSPERLPRPAVQGPAGPVPLPLAADQSLLERRETGEGPLMAWTPRIQLRSLGSAWLLEVDVRPYRRPAASPDQADVQSAFRHAERRLAEAPLAMTGELNVDPGRRFRLERRPKTSEEQPLPSEATLRKLGQPLASDALLVSLDQGESWWLAGIADAAAGRHALDSDQVFADAGRVLLAPRALAPDAALELLAFTPPAPQPARLPFPQPRQAPWRCEISDLRRHDGELEALVLVHDPQLRRAPDSKPADSWAVRLGYRDGTWHERERFTLPGDGRLLRLRFETNGDVLLMHGGTQLARRPRAGS